MDTPQTIIYPSTMRMDRVITNLLSAKISISENAETGFGHSYGALKFFHETTIAGGHSETETASGNLQLIVLPLIGSIHFGNHAYTNQVTVGEVGILTVHAGQNFFIANEFSSTPVHYLVAGIESTEDENCISSFTFLESRCIPIFKKEAKQGLRKLSIGEYTGRSEGIYNSSGYPVFAYIIDGAFEIQDCLLEKSDGLLIPNAETISFEALSGQGIVFLIEFNS